MKNSEIISSFLNLIKDAESDYQYAIEAQKVEETKTQDILHMLELDNLNYKERAKLATQLQEIRKVRRKYKAEVEELEEIVRFKREHENFLKLLRELLGRQRKIENIHGNRHYVPKIIKRVKDE